MNSRHQNYVFLMDCADFSEAQVVRSYLLSQGFHPRVRDEQTRGVAPHFGQLLGKLTLEIPEDEYMDASLSLEKVENTTLKVAEEPEDEHDIQLRFMARRAVWNAVLGTFILPVVCNLYSMWLCFKVFRAEFPIAKANQRFLIIASLFNAASFYFWLTIAPKLFLADLFLKR